MLSWLYPTPASDSRFKPEKYNKVLVFMVSEHSHLFGLPLTQLLLWNHWACLLVNSAQKRHTLQVFLLVIFLALDYLSLSLHFVSVLFSMQLMKQIHTSTACNKSASHQSATRFYAVFNDRRWVITEGKTFCTCSVALFFKQNKQDTWRHTCNALYAGDLLIRI